MIRVGYIAGEPTAWRVPHLDRIADQPAIDLTVIYAAPTVQQREWTLEPRHAPIVLGGPSLPLTRILHHDYPLTPQIWGLLERERFDVLVIGGWSLMATQLAIVWARIRHVPYLVVAENHLREERPLWIRAAKSIVLRQVIPQAAGHLVTGSLARDHALRYGARPEDVTVFPNTVDVAAYRSAAERLKRDRPGIRPALGVADDAIVVTQVGRLMSMKAPEDTLEAFIRAGAMTSRPLHLLFVGDGPLRGPLERRAKAAGIDVTFAGFRRDEALLECYAATDVFALLSHRETWGTVVNEAAAFGLPLVLTDRVGAAADLLEPGGNGELVHAGDIDGEARAIAKLANDDALRTRYGARSAELIAGWGYEPSVETFVQAVERAVTAPRRA
jgi:glycosyltransferase involved in cell wall biosynthesis